MGFANPPEWATTTSPEAVFIIVKLCLDAGAKRVIVCDNTLRDPDICKQKSGIADAVIQTNEQHRRAFIVRKGGLHPIPEGFMMLAPTRRLTMFRTRSAWRSTSVSDSMPAGSSATPSALAFSRAPVSIAWKNGFVVAL
jgi:hypothetical protein